MKKLVLYFLLPTLICFVSFTSINATGNAPANVEPSTNIKFFVGSFESAKIKAQGEGKLFFVDFYANWCTPCKWMEESTFTNPDVIDQLTENYIAFKVDIDKTEGYELKKKYGVRILPTLLIFNKEGELVERVEETLDSKKLSSLLTFHAENNVAIINHRPNSSPSAPDKTDDAKELDELYKQYKEKLSRESRSFNAQIGNYPDYKEAYAQVNAIRKQFLEPIVVITEHKNGITYYKVLLGEFDTIEEANSFCKILQSDFDIKAIVH